MKVKRAGLIPYCLEDGVLQMLFMIPSDAKYGGPDPQIAKGCIDKNEGIIEAALREAEEELGLVLDNVVPGTITHALTEKKIAVYTTEVYSRDNFNKHDHETAYTLWLTPDEFYYWGRKLHKPYVKAAVKIIQQMVCSQKTKSRS